MASPPAGSVRTPLLCEFCQRNSEILTTHLRRVCKKGASDTTIRALSKKARSSMIAFLNHGRILDYNEIQTLQGADSLTSYLEAKGHVVKNKPVSSSGSKSAVAQIEGAASAAAAGDTRDEAERNPDEDREKQAAAGDADQDSDSDSPVKKKRNRPQWTVVIRKKMEDAGMYSKYSLHTPLLRNFKYHLRETLGVRNCKQEVENVSRYLYFMNPQKACMDFVKDIIKTNLFFTKLKNIGLKTQTLCSYLKNIRRFVYYHTTATNLRLEEPQLYQACCHFLGAIKATQKSFSKGVSRESVNKKYKTLMTPSLKPEECHRLLDVAKEDFLESIENAETGDQLFDKDKRCILYYLEALLILGHLQRPGVVANMTVEEWHERFHYTFDIEGGTATRVVVGVKRHKTATRQVATFALTEGEETWFNTYFNVVRPTLLNDGSPKEEFFISTSGDKIYNVSNDLRRLHEKYKLKNITSQMVRRACETWTLAEYSDTEKSLFAKYLAHTNLTADTVYREKTLKNICLASLLVARIGLKNDPEEDQARGSRSGSPDNPSVDFCKQQDFNKLVRKFTVTLGGQPPKSKACKRISPLYWRYCVKKWTDVQSERRSKHVIKQFPARLPTEKQLSKYIEREQWNCSRSDAQLLLQSWKPRPADKWRNNEYLQRNVHLQKWKGLRITSNDASGTPKVIAKRPFMKGEAICDFHGDLLKAKQGRQIPQSSQKSLLFYADTEGKEWCINPCCSCHPGLPTIVGNISRSRKHFNVKPVYTEHFGVLLVAAKDIPANQELRLSKEI